MIYYQDDEHGIAFHHTNDNISTTIPGFECYVITNKGEIFENIGHEEWYEVVCRVKTYMGSHGYPQAFLLSTATEKKELHPVHWFMARAFLGERNPGYEVNHVDGVKTNNNIENLQLVSHYDNMKHARETGLIKQTGSIDPKERKRLNDIIKKCRKEMFMSV